MAFQGKKLRRLRFGVVFYLVLALEFAAPSPFSRAASPDTCAANFAQITIPNATALEIRPGELLPSFPVGTGEGKTAGELGIQGIVHFTTPESIGSILTADENGVLLIKAAKTHAFGNGFYTLRSDIGLNSYSLSSGHTPVQFVLDPAARSGTDFSVEMDYDEMLSYIIIKNRAALRPAGKMVLP